MTAAREWPCFAMFAAIALAFSSSASAAETTAAASVDYLKQIKPLLKERCFSCHGALKQEAGLRLDTIENMKRGGDSGPAIAPGDPSASLLMKAIRGDADATAMPPVGEASPLNSAQQASLAAWIDAGAAGPPQEAPEADPRDHWAFRRPVRPAPPAADSSANPVDRFVAAEWANHQLQPSSLAPPEVQLRRVSFDLIGLPPSREILHEFLADPSDAAYARIVDRLLQSPQYGERWARHWMDVWRYSDWYGRRSVPDWWNSACQIWRWRDWIVASLNDDCGYDVMIQEMLAGDELAGDQDDRAVATGFLARNWYALNYNAWMRDNVEHTAKAFLGLTFQCAHCHDHKYDPISNVDYFRLRAFFEPLEMRQDRWPGEPDPGPFQKYEYSSLRKVVPHGAIRVFDERMEAPTFIYSGGDERNKLVDRGPVTAGVPGFLDDGEFKIEPISLPPRAWYPGIKPAIQETMLADANAAVSAAVQAVAAAQAGGVAMAEAAERAARANLVSLVARIDAERARHGETPNVDVGALVRTASLKEREARLLQAEADAAAKTLALSQAEAKPTTDANRDKEIEAAKAAVAAASTAVDEAKKALADEALAETFAPLSPQYPAVSSGRRTALARWIANSKNPLTARVAVNHMWLRHFGQALVESVYDFGRNGKPPSHPELLDWLAVEFMESGWSQKHLHRVIVTSRTYRQTSATAGEPAASNRNFDPDNKYLWRYPARRLEAEAIRDAMLSVAGALDLTAGGKELEVDQDGATFRRSMYYSTHPEDGGRLALLENFDVPDTCDCYRRSESILPQQALALTNSPLARSMSRKLARTLWDAAAPNVPLAADAKAMLVRAAFEQILSRGPSDVELAVGQEFWAKLAATSAGGEPAAAEIAALESLIHALLNHHEFVTIR